MAARGRLPLKMLMGAEQLSLTVDNGDKHCRTMEHVAGKAAGHTCERYVTFWPP